MSLDPSTVGFQTEPFVFEYDFQRTVLYALGVGATRDELDFLYEGRGPRVLPSFAVVPAYAAATALFERTGCDLTRLRHSAQSVRLQRPIPAAGKLETVGIVQGVYDMKRFAQVVLQTRTSVRGELLFETEWQLLVRDAGGFGGARPPKSEVHRVPEGATPAFEAALGTSPEQALLYRLSGDLNPLHADPAFAALAGFDAPILHGLCTFGIATRALVRHLGGDERRIRAIGGQFRKPVWPGETIRTQGYATTPGRFTFEAFAAERPDPVITNGWAEVTS
ncbi:MAG TPA: MaoC/PaaZ C-terminal domain-containing protein [Polyangiaceae bacterium]|nr:MaoC/PaaZ C-terminal domain-containing protein [Polyangiaceae bacterium]